MEESENRTPAPNALGASRLISKGETGRRVEQFAQRRIEPGDGRRHQPREVLSPEQSVAADARRL